MNVICFDLEGPLSPQDNAYEIMGLFENGHRLFEIISRYDDILTLERRADYEAGDTLKLILPFLFYYGITDEDIKKVSDTAKIVDGVVETIKQLQANDWDVYIISTSYSQHAHNIGAKIGIAADKIHCTTLSLNDYRKYLNESDLSFIGDVARIIVKLTKDSEIKEYLDRFYFKDLAGKKVGRIIEGITVCGGERKLKAVLDIVKDSDRNVDEVIVVGDSITDYKMLRMVREAGGLSIVFNGNEYALPYGNVGLASMSMKPLIEITDLYVKGGKDGVRQAILDVKNTKDICFHWLEDINKKELDDILKIHKKFREKVRGKAANLG